jgi:hypothetical protein
MIFVVHVHAPLDVWRKLAVDVLQDFAAGRGSLRPRGAVIGEIKSLLMVVSLITMRRAEKLARHSRPPRH